MSGDELTRIGEQIIEMAKSRDYSFEPWELDRALKVVTKIISLATSYSYAESYAKARLLLCMAFSIIEVAEKKSAGAVTPNGQNK